MQKYITLYKIKQIEIMYLLSLTQVKHIFLFVYFYTNKYLYI